jgi:hypothetical protein
MSEFIACEKCHKRLIERTDHGTWRFRFGRPAASFHNDKKLDSPVDMEIEGTVAMKCFRCGHLNLLTNIAATAE